MEDHVEGELGREEREEPLGGVHVRLQPHVQEVSVQIRDAFLSETHTGGGTRLETTQSLNMSSDE